ncbi:MAG: DegT/DnrJ/EryC1/StrS family aminotransferase, partial [Calditrichaeota bacterium]|nr:DegT/DnrJ/EryC1/StrS family aminotransferase [Calditrichota bacterium]
LEEAETITRKRWIIHNYYAEQFTSLETRGHLRLPFAPQECQHNAHMFYLILKDSDTRDRLIQYLKKRGISTVFHYIPLHSSPIGLKMGYYGDDLRVTEDLSVRLVRLPCYFELTKDDQDRVVEAVGTFFEK